MTDFKNLIKSVNEHIMKLYSVFFFEFSIYLIYENMKVCFNDILIILRGRLPY
jgi:hypothetical protein